MVGPTLQREMAKQVVQEQRGSIRLACERFGWKHKRVYRIYYELELNFRIKPRKRLTRKKPDSLCVPEAINQVWSMNFMHDQLPERA